MEQSTAAGVPNGHPLSEMEGLSDTFVAGLANNWVTTVEEAVAWLASDGVEDAERDAFLVKASELLGVDRVAELSKPASVKTFGCELPDETKEVQS